jgi:hypothetical protein
VPPPRDFRSLAFDAARVDASGKNVGRNVYWKLFAIENLMRVVTHSVLLTQVGPDWWTKAVDVGIQKSVASMKAAYSNKPWHGGPGGHEIYFTLLSELTKIVAANSHLFQPIITDIDAWVARLEQIRVPRNVVGHMNWPATNDRRRIDLVYSDLQGLVGKLAAAKSVAFAIP